MRLDRKHLLAWGLPAGGLLLASLLVAWTHVLPSPVPADAPADRFSAERALRIVRHLTEEIGMRPNGTQAHERAAEYLAGVLRGLPGVEVELQRPSGVHRFPRGPIPFPPFVYRTLNVVARIEGRRPEAVLLDAHYDTLTESTGAGDDAMGVAAIVEAARVLASGPKLEHSVVILLNGAEEAGMLGAAGFLRHRWAKDVRAYLYLDGGPRGKPVVIGAGPHNPWLLRTFAGAAPSPTATVIGQDILASGMLPHSGDFVPFHDAGLVGVDIAALGDFWAVHTEHDRVERIDPSTMQLLGESLLAGAQALAASELPGNVDRRPLVYYDVLGLVVPVYSTTTARILALLAIALVAGAVVLARRRGVLTLRQVAGGFVRILFAALAALVAALLAAALVGLAFGRPHGWFASPWVGVWAFGAPAVAAALGVLALRRRCPPDLAPLAAWAGAAVFWGLLLVLLTVAGAGSAYLALWWAAPVATGLVLAVLRPQWRAWLWLAAFVPGAVLTLEFTVLVLPFAIADTGLVPAPAPLDLLVASLVGLTVLVIAPVGLAPVAGARRLSVAAAACAVLAVVGLAIAAVKHPYDAERPKRVAAAIVARDGSSSLQIASRDALPLDPVLARVPEAETCDDPWAPVPGMDAPFTHCIPAAPPGFAEPRVEVLSSDTDGAGGVREVRLRLVTDGPKLRLFVPKRALVGWSLGSIPERSLDPDRVLVVFEGAAEEDREITLRLRGQDPVEVELVDVRGPSHAPAVRSLRRRLPRWANLETTEIWSVKERI